MTRSHTHSGLRLRSLVSRAYFRDMKSVALNEAKSKLEQLFDEAQTGSPVLLVRGDEFVKLERVEPPAFGGGLQTLEKILLEAVRGPHADWTPQDLEDISA